MRSWTPRRPHRPRVRRDSDRWTPSFAVQFPPWLRERGEAIFAAGDVALEAVSAGHVRATVLGTESHIVELRRHASALALSSSCPYFRRDAGPCKHLWALLLAAEEDGRFAPGRTGRVMRRGQVLGKPGEPEADDAPLDEEAAGEVDEDEDFKDDDFDLDDLDFDDDEATGGFAPKAWPVVPATRPPPRTVPPPPSLPAPRKERWAEALTYLTQASAGREASWAPEREILGQQHTAPAGSARLRHV